MMITENKFAFLAKSKWEKDLSGKYFPTVYTKGVFSFQLHPGIVATLISLIIALGSLFFDDKNNFNRLQSGFLVFGMGFGTLIFFGNMASVFIDLIKRKTVKVYILESIICVLYIIVLFLI